MSTLDDMNMDGLTPEQIIRKCHAMLGVRELTSEEWEEYYRQEKVKQEQEQERLSQWYNEGAKWVYRRCCPVCNTVFYTTNPRRKYDDYYKCSRYIHRSNAKWKRKLSRDYVKCEVCGKYFLPKRNDVKYCSTACKQKAYRQRKQRDQNEHTEKP